jgi:hypothetical protein
VSLQTNEPGETSVVQQDESTTGPSHVQTMYFPSETGETGRDWHRGSHVRYTELLRKHLRQPQGAASLTHCITSLHGITGEVESMDLMQSGISITTALHENLINRCRKVELFCRTSNEGRIKLSIKDTL